MSQLKQFIRNVPDFPKQGIVFRDISPLFRAHFPQLIEEMAAMFSDHDRHSFEYIAGIEARGFAVASALACRLGKGFIPVRKKGKLPPEVVRVSYNLEYGQDSLEMHYGSGKVLLVDDVLATGGTFTAAAELCEKTGHELVGLACIINLAYLNNFHYKNVSLKSLITFSNP